MDILVIPDAHCHPDYGNERFDMLGEYILDEKPDTIVCLGDLADMPSLSSYDKGRKSFEGRRYRKDCAATIDAQKRLWYPVNQYNEMRAKNRKALYKPDTIITMGNHEERILRAIEESPELDGAIGYGDLGVYDFWDRVVPFRETVEVAGFYFSHHFPSGRMGRPIGGENVAARTISKHHESCIFGHGHVLDYAERVGIGGKRLVGISAGCYVHPYSIEDWNKSFQHMWWLGVVMLRGVENGEYKQAEFVSQKSLFEKYGDAL